MLYSAPRRNAVAYLLWRWLLRNNGSFVAWLDGFFFGPSRGMNDYDSLAASYRKSDVKPDKRYSILPTVLQMVGDCENKTVIDIGCGTGFFTLYIAELGASLVYGLDNSEIQMRLASEMSAHTAIRYFCRDAFVDPLPYADIIVTPFVVNYARTTAVLQHFIRQLHDHLHDGGKAVFVIDLPNSKGLKRFGATKIFLGPRADETTIQIDLFNEELKICSLTAVYFTPETIEHLLREAGFRNINWHKAIVSDEGVRSMGIDFWKGYLNDPELGYLTAER